MADISKIKLPNNSVVNIKDARITGVDTTPTSGSTNVVESGGIKEAIMESAGEVIIGTQTAATGNWTGVSKLATASDMKSGYRFTYWLPYAGSGNATLTLTFQDGTTKAIDCYIRGASRLTTHIPAGNKIDFCYLENASVAGTKYTGAWIDPGYWDGNTYDRIFSNYERRFIYSTATPLYRYKICGYNNGKIVPLVVTNQTSATIIDKTPVTVGLDPYAGLVIYNATTNITDTSSAIGSFYNELPANGYSQYTFNDNVPVYKDVYLKGTIGEDGLFYLDTTTHKSWYVFAPNRESDGKYNSVFEDGSYYMFVGPTITSVNNFQLKYNNPVYFFNGERLIPLEEVKSGEVEKSTEFLYRKSTSLTQGYYSAKEIKGRTLVWNQLAQNSQFPSGLRTGITYSHSTKGLPVLNGTNTALDSIGGWLGLNNTAEFYNHKVYYCARVLSGGIGGATLPEFYFTYPNNTNTGRTPINTPVITTINKNEVIRSVFYIYEDTTFTNTEIAFTLIDLTLMFGAGNEPATVEEFESMFPLPYYEYNPGELISFNATEIRTVGRNLWNKAHVESGYINDGDGESYQSAKTSFHTGYVEVTPNTVYYIRSDAPNGNWGAWYDSEKNFISGQIGVGRATSPENAFYFRRTVKYNGNIGDPDTFCISIYDSSFNGQYEPYKSSTLNLSIPSMTSGGAQVFPDGMRSAGDAYDEAIVDSDGYVRKVVKRIGNVNGPSFTLHKTSSANYKTYRYKLTDEKPASITNNFNYVNSFGIRYHGSLDSSSVDYETIQYNNTTDRVFYVSFNPNRDINDFILYYELSTPVEYTLDNPIFVGTEYYSGGIQKVLPENTSEPTTAPFRGKFGYRDYSYVEKQDKLTFDTTPTENSANPVTSGGLNTEFGKVSYVGDNLGTETYTDSGNVVTDLSGYATKAWVEAKGYLTTESDPGVYAWAKAATKPTYTASEVGALPNTTVIPTKLTQLTNDAGYIVGYTETDPTVPAWAKAANKPTYAASEITNDVGYLKYVLLQSESDMPANPDSGTLYLIPE